MKRSAVLSECQKYRYRLERTWDESLSTLYVVMLNPSTADAEIDDPTIRKCIGFAKTNLFGSIVVFNLFAWRATVPTELIKTQCDVVGPENNVYISQIPEDASVLCAWGSFAVHPKLNYRVAIVKHLLKGRQLLCVKKSENRPWHPLYVKYGCFEIFQ
jgi:hypothetical protein